MPSTSSASLTPTTPTTLTSSIPFLRVPNIIIQHSLLYNHYILPLYLYSGIHSNPNYFDVVDTNLSLISETFSPSNPSTPAKFQDALLYLLEDVDDTDILPGFSQPFQLYTPPPSSTSPSFTKTTRLQYGFLNRSCKMDNSWTKLTYNEYFYILERITELNSNRQKTELNHQQTELNSNRQKTELNPTQNTPHKSKYNAIELFNLYLYFKQKINLYTYSRIKYSPSSSSNSSSKHQSTKTTRKSKSGTYNSLYIHSSPCMRESLNTIISNTTFSRNTLTKYTNQLIELGLISVKRGSFCSFKNGDNISSQKECNEYFLSYKWVDYYNSMNS